MTKTILFVDDSSTMRQVAQMTFAAEPYELVVVESADAAEAYFEKGTTDAAIVDLTLPDRDGFELCRAFKKETGLPVIVMYPSSEPPNPAELTKSGADSAIAKPFSTQMLIDETARVVSQRARSGAAFEALASPISDPDFMPGSSESALMIEAEPPPDSDGGPALSFDNPAVPSSFASARTGPPPAPPTAPPKGARPQTPVHGTPLLETTRRVSPSSAVAPARKKHSSVKLPAPPPGMSLPQGFTTDSKRRRPALTQEAEIIDSMPAGLDEVDPQVREAVAVLTREIVEQIVWEVVPDLAETIIREQLDQLIAKRTK